jgi:hypothetical protein
MREVTKDTGERLRGLVEALRVGHYDLIPFNIGTPTSGSIIFASSRAATGPMIFS